MRGRGIPLLPPDVNASLPIFSVEEAAAGSAAGSGGPGELGADAATGGAGVRFALAAIKGVGRAAMAALVDERAARGPYASLFDLTRRLAGKGFNRRLLEALVKAGALDSLDDNRARLTGSIDAAIAYAAAVKSATESAQTGLFGGGGETVPEPRPIEAEEWDLTERLAQEFAVLGVYLSAHPLDGYATALERLGVVPAAQVFASPERFDGQTIELTGVVVAKKEKKTERSRFAFVQLSDASAQYEVMLFADVLEQSRSLLEIGTAVLVSADVRTDGEDVKLSGQRLRPLDRATERLGSLLDIEIAEPATAVLLKPHLVEGGNGADVRLVIHMPDGREVVVALPEALSLSHAKWPTIERLAGVIRINEQPRQAIRTAH
jgi:DNA polymerase-3 subunit alpha